MVGLGPRSAIERAEIGNSRPTVVRACALLDPPPSNGVGLNPHDLCRIATRRAKVVAANATSRGDLAFRQQVRVTTLSPVPLSQSPGHSLRATATHNRPPVASAEAQITRCHN